MKTFGAANASHLSGVRNTGTKPRSFFTITVKDWVTGVGEDFCFWSGDQDISAQVISGTTGLAVSRSFVGGVNFDHSEVPMVADLTIQTVDIRFSSLAPIAAEIVKNHDCRLARCELHEGWLDAGGLLVGPAEIAFLGIVDEAPSDIPGVGDGDAMTNLRIISEAIAMLARTNPAKRSFEGQKRRSADQYRLYKNTIKTWQVPWGTNS
jgi:hypothetical protein